MQLGQSGAKAGWLLAGLPCEALSQGGIRAAGIPPFVIAHTVLLWPGVKPNGD